MPDQGREQAVHAASLAEGVTSEESDFLCAYCHSDISKTAVETCPFCGSPYHASCWEENGGCALASCAGQASAISHIESGAPTLPANWSSSGPMRQGGNDRSRLETAPSASLLRPLATTSGTSATIVSRSSSHNESLRRWVILALLISLPILSSLGTRNNWFSPVTGHVYSASEYRLVEQTAFADGRSAGYRTGVDVGESTGYDEGFSDGESAGYDVGYNAGSSDGCLSVFNSLNAFKVVDSFAWEFGLGYTTTLSRSACY